MIFWKIFEKEICYSALSQKNKNKLKIMQNKIIPFVLGMGPRTHIGQEELGINKGLLQPQGELYPFRRQLTIAVEINSSGFVRVSMRQ